MLFVFVVFSFFFRKWFDYNSPYSLSYILRKGSRKGASSSSFNHSNSVFRTPPLRGSLPFGILSRILKRKLLLCNSSRNLNQNREWSRSLLFFLDSHRYFRCTGRFLNWCTRSFRCRKRFLFTRRSGCLIHHIFFFSFLFFSRGTCTIPSVIALNSTKLLVNLRFGDSSYLVFILAVEYILVSQNNDRPVSFRQQLRQRTERHGFFFFYCLKASWSPCQQPEHF